MVTHAAVLGWLVLALGTFGVGAAHGQGSWSPVELLPGAVSDVDMKRPALAVDGAGNVVAVWMEPNGVRATIRAARFDAVSAAWNQPVDLARDIGRDYAEPVIAGDRAGNVVAAWIDGRIPPNRVRVARYSASTGAWGSAETIVTAGAATDLVGDLAIAGNAAGNVVLMWWNGRASSRAGPIQSARYSPASGTWSAPENRSVTAARLPRVAMDSAGNAYALWGAEFSHYVVATDTWSSPTHAGPITAVDDGMDLRLAASRVGAAIAIWRDRAYDPVSGLQTGVVVKSSTYSDATGGWSSPVTLSPTDQSAGPGHLAVNARGDAVATWDFLKGPSIYRRGIRAISYAAASGTWQGGDVDIANDALYNVAPQAAIDESGNVTAVWVVHDDPNAVLRAARRPSPGGWEAPVTLRQRFGSLDTASVAPQLPVDDTGNVRVVWAFETYPDSYHIESTRWLANGNPGPPTGPPGAPRNLVGTVSGNIVNLTWDAPIGGASPTSYTLVGRVSSGGPLVGTVQLGPSRTFSAAAPNGTFVLSVAATNASGMGPESSPVTVTVPQVPPAPGAPSAFAAVVSGSTVSFTWSPPSSGGAVGNYVLLAGTTPAFSTPLASIPLGAATSFAVPGVPPGTYYVRVLAQNAGGTSAPSNEVAFTVAGLTAPGAPTLQTPVVNGSTVALSWSPGAGGPPAGYTLIARATPGGTPIASVPLGGTSVSFSGVPSGTYYLALTASNAAGVSAPSVEVALVVP